MLLNEILNPGYGYFCKDLLRSSQRLTKQSSLNKFLSCVLELEKKTVMLMIACILVTRCRERSCYCFGNFFFYGYLLNSQKVLFRLPMGNIGLLHLWALLTETPVYQVRCVQQEHDCVWLTKCPLVEVEDTSIGDNPGLLLYAWFKIHACKDQTACVFILSDKSDSQPYSEKPLFICIMVNAEPHGSSENENLMEDSENK